MNAPDTFSQQRRDRQDRHVGEKLLSWMGHCIGRDNLHNVALSSQPLDSAALELLAHDESIVRRGIRVCT